MDLKSYIYAQTQTKKVTEQNKQSQTCNMYEKNTEQDTIHHREGSIRNSKNKFDIIMTIIIIKHILFFYSLSETM